MFTTIQDAYHAYCELFGSEKPIWSRDQLQRWLHLQPWYNGYERITPEQIGEAVDASIAEDD